MIVGSYTTYNQQLQQSQYAYPDTLLGSAPITDAPFINANALMRSSSHITQSDDISVF
ncbi:15480_t:CDS:2, partial [Funneliformis geosporum]